MIDYAQFDLAMRKIKELEERLAEYEWKPIETVPRDRVVDLWHKKFGRMSENWWVGDSWASTGEGDSVYSHWMPIPESPKDCFL